MKVNKNILIDLDLAKLLSEEENQSKLINNLLRGYFSQRETANIDEVISRENAK